MKIVKYAIVVICLLSLTGLAVERASAYFFDIEQSSGNVFQAAVPEPEPIPPVSGGGGGGGVVVSLKTTSLATGGITSSRANITWTTSRASTSIFTYWASPEVVIENDDYVKEHSVYLEDLASDTTYSFKIVCKDGFGLKSRAEGMFTTLEAEMAEPEPVPPEPVEPELEEPEPEPVITPAPAPPVGPEPVTPMPEEPEGIQWLLICVLIAIGVAIIAGYWIYRRKKKRTTC